MEEFYAKPETFYPYFGAYAKFGDLKLHKISERGHRSLRDLVFGWRAPGLMMQMCFEAFESDLNKQILCPKELGKTPFTGFSLK